MPFASRSRLSWAPTTIRRTVGPARWKEWSLPKDSPAGSCGAPRAEVIIHTPGLVRSHQCATGVTGAKAPRRGLPDQVVELTVLGPLDERRDLVGRADEHGAAGVAGVTDCHLAGRQPRQLDAVPARVAARALAPVGVEQVGAQPGIMRL